MVFKSINKGNEEMINWGTEIRGQRIKKGIPLKPIADDCKIHISTLTRIESNQHFPRISTLSKIIDVLDGKIEVTFNE